MLESDENRQQDPELNPASSGYNSAFVTHCYTNFLRRQPGTSGFNWWLNVLNSTGDYSGSSAASSPPRSTASALVSSLPPVRAQATLSPNKAEAVAVVLAASSSKVTPLSSATFFAVSTTYAGSFFLPR